MVFFRSSCLLALFLGACATVSGSRPLSERPPAVCERLPLLERYARSDLVKWLPDGRVSLSVRTDLHAADCGNSDCYGTNLTAVFRLSPEGGSCLVREVEVNARDTGCGIPEDNPPMPTETFFAQGASDLADPTLEKLTLMSGTGAQALVILRANLFYFDDVKPGGELHTQLSTDDDTESCCWGASMAEAHFKAEQTP